MAKTKTPQPEVNIGLVGHVDHGKTTLTQSLSGKWTDTHSEEIKRGITIRLGYADATFYKCEKCETYGVKETCPKCNSKAKESRKVSFVDAPGHESLMATMLSGSAMMDGALLLVAANEFCPQPQTKEHIMALEIVGIKNVIIVQNKIDTVTKNQAIENQKQIKKFLENTPYKDAPIIPISAQHNINIDILIQTIEEIIPTPKRDPKTEPIFTVARSFDINKPGSQIDNMLGGILGGALLKGTLKQGQEIEIRPGRKVEEKNKIAYYPLKTKIVTLRTGNQEVKEIHPGGSVAILTELDPAIVKSDTLSGSLIGNVGKVPKTWDTLKLELNLLKRVVGSKEDLNVDPIRKMEPLMLNVNSSATVGVVVDLGKNIATCRLKLPVCAEPGSRVTISRMIGNRFRLIGYGIIKD